ncbi:hypothetical protein [Myceligenerans indicum]|uniref:Uncharacterized protein n=1 Tax=Myceligenerans indicum TaxID=2593663 RepID=A0ABS1LEY7_9MICO|nr:hypothetical protein [Myceligenerans indicum]MBL0884768.1 hypothetical protein [Myceligenerans indicum]
MHIDEFGDEAETIGESLTGTMPDHGHASGRSGEKLQSRIADRAATILLKVTT